jgi:DNA polymerase-3 subunit chi
MAQVDFYLLNSASNEHERDHFICRLVEKIHRQRHTIYIHCKDRQESHKLDELLWTFSDISFIPHCLYGESANSPPPIQLGFDSTPQKHDVLINLSSTIPLFYAAFRRILEVVPQQEEQQIISREHYQFYKSQDLEIKTHKIG